MYFQPTISFTTQDNAKLFQCIYFQSTISTLIKNDTFTSIVDNDSHSSTNKQERDLFSNKNCTTSIKYTSRHQRLLSMSWNFQTSWKKCHQCSLAQLKQKEEKQRNVLDPSV